MRYFVTGEQNRQLLLNAIVLLFLAYMLVFWVSIGMMYFHQMNLTPASVVEYYLGAESKFTQPRSYRSLLEVSHAHLFSMGMLAVTLAHLLLFANVSTGLKVGLSVLVFFSAIAEEAAGWLVRFAHPAFAWFKIGAFVTLELSLAALIVLVAASLIAQRSALKHASQKRFHHPLHADAENPRVRSRTARTPVTKA